MISIKPLPEFTEWMDGLSDLTVRGVAPARIKRLALSLMGDIAPVGEGALELRIHIGADPGFEPGPTEGKINDSTHQSSRPA